MKKMLLLCLTLVAAMAGAAGAEDIAGKFGITGRIGFQVPANSEVKYGGGSINTLSTNVGFIGGGGLMYGINKHFAAEIDVTNSSFSGNDIDFNVVNLSLGGQYRFKEFKGFTPFVGAGLDILLNGASGSYNVDNNLGAHVNGGVDYFFMKNFAVTTELKLVIAPNTDITNAAGKQGNFDPSSFNMTFGVRYFIN